ncbi:hypothetical protein M885DRAFT_564098 [Pelagophyceae sp. CCMP2097]|nr:hypothetical protein M885DRAFT_564098 [Pelagophyceae sp. CCMP2097]
MLSTLLRAAALLGMAGAVCEDDANWHTNGKTSKDCSWVFEKPGDRCAALDASGVPGYLACRAACLSCPQPCADVTDDATWNDGGCADVRGDRGEMCGDSDADGMFAFQACPGSCLTCEGDSWCSDSEEWRGDMKGTSSDKQTCQWVSLNADDRCGIVDDEGMYAYQACKTACFSCDSAVDCEAPDAASCSSECGSMNSNMFTYQTCPHACGLCTYDPTAAPTGAPSTGMPSYAPSTFAPTTAVPSYAPTTVAPTLAPTLLGEGKARFMAYASESMMVNVSDVVTFDMVPINAGKGFDANASAFVAPNSGTYVVSLTVLGSPSAGRGVGSGVEVRVDMEGTGFGLLFAKHESKSITVPIKLNRGQSLDVAVVNGPLEVDGSPAVEVETADGGMITLEKTSVFSSVFSAYLLPDVEDKSFYAAYVGDSKAQSSKQMEMVIDFDEPITGDRYLEYAYEETDTGTLYYPELKGMYLFAASISAEMQKGDAAVVNVFVDGENSKFGVEIPLFQGMTESQNFALVLQVGENDAIALQAKGDEFLLVGAESLYNSYSTALKLGDAASRQVFSAVSDSYNVPATGNALVFGKEAAFEVPASGTYLVSLKVTLADAFGVSEFEVFVDGIGSCHVLRVESGMKNSTMFTTSAFTAVVLRLDAGSVVEVVVAQTVDAMVAERSKSQYTTYFQMTALDLLQDYEPQACLIPDTKFQSLGDGFCDASFNTPECGYDGGDCCSATCMANATYTCGSGTRGECKDPSAYLDEVPYPVICEKGDCDCDDNAEGCPV